MDEPRRGESGGVIARANIDGPFAVGAKITTRVEGYPSLTSTVTRVETPRIWTGVAKAPGLTQTIEHVVEPTDAGALLTERTTFTGPLASIAARVLGGRLRKTLEATTTDDCARLAERRKTSYFDLKKG